jgi:hypothetical protein
MPVRATETRIPASLRPADLGEAVVAADERCALVSCISSQLVLARDNTYIVFVTDGGLAGSTEAYEWSFAEGSRPPQKQRTAIGEITYRPTAEGALQIVVRLLDGADQELAQLSLSQEIVPLHAGLEALIENAKNEPGPGVGNPDVARELVNDHNPYYQGVTTESAENGDAFQRFVFSMVHDGAQQRSVQRRREHLNRLSATLNDGGAELATVAAEGAGVCSIRLALLAMIVPRSADADVTPLLEWTELPDVASRRAVADEQLRARLASLDMPAKLDLFNIARFPKSNIVHCAKLIESLRDRYFDGATFEDVLTGMGGTRAHWILRHYREGPLMRV